MAKSQHKSIHATGCRSHSSICSWKTNQYLIRKTLQMDLSKNKKKEFHYGSLYLQIN
jgi:hypothetical protein